MPQPKADPPRCDVPGCGIVADRCTDGSEPDVQGLGRKPLSFINTCPHHENWPFSDDAQKFALESAAYKARAKVKG
jgi:hypothetical protein